MRTSATPSSARTPPRTRSASTGRCASTTCAAPGTRPTRRTGGPRSAGPSSGRGQMSRRRQVGPVALNPAHYGPGLTIVCPGILIRDGVRTGGCRCTGPWVRSFHWAKGAAHFPGSWWSSTTSAHVGFESWLERDHVMPMDFDPGITGIASQPSWLRPRPRRPVSLSSWGWKRLAQPRS